MFLSVYLLCIKVSFCPIQDINCSENLNLTKIIFIQILFIFLLNSERFESLLLKSGGLRQIKKGHAKQCSEHLLSI
jgi:hypothetical protein